jgi:hypothetical protein
MQGAAERLLRLLVNDMYGRDSLAELWNAFELEYLHLGFGQLTVVAHHCWRSPPVRLTWSG